MTKDQQRVAALENSWGSGEGGGGGYLHKGEVSLTSLLTSSTFFLQRCSSTATFTKGTMTLIFAISWYGTH